MSKQYYECHVTFESKKPEVIEMDVELHGWKFSCINGDPILGEGIKCYATKHYSPSKYSIEQVVSMLLTFSQKMKSFGHEVIRDKVELVVYDSKLVKV